MSKKSYHKDDLTVHWDSEKCIHSGICAKGLPGVFDSKRVPWIDPDQADKEKIREQVRLCPSGALSLEQEEAQNVGIVKFHPVSKGPLRVEGKVEIHHPDGCIEQREGKFSLCRCSHSSTMPYCDGTHKNLDLPES